MTSSNIRVRFAPSPTGAPHIGNIRSALFNWLFARHTGGAFVLRIEDTDQARKAEGAVEAIFDSLRWMGLDWDEGPDVGGPYGPYAQSKRVALYQKIAQQLVEGGDAYHCYCTPEELAEMRKRQQRLGQQPRYDRRCRNLSNQERKGKEGLPCVVRFKMPLEGPLIIVRDIIRGEVSFDPALLDDFVLLKSDGFPTYHLANVADDHAMHISHVLRAEEWLPSTPRHLLLYQALGYEPPLFGHLPMILGPDRSKLSKRHGATALLDYQREGYLPEAMLNFLALLGWSLDDKTEIIPLDDLIEHFSLERVSKSPAIFNIEKLAWMNGMYIRQLPQGDLAKRMSDALSAYVRERNVEVHLEPTPGNLKNVAPLLRERLRTMKPEEVWSLTDFFLLDMPGYQVAPIPKGLTAHSTRVALQATIDALEPIAEFNAAMLETVLRPLAERLGMKTRDLFGSIRIAVTGRTAAPPLFDTMAALGKERTLARLRHTLSLVDQ